MFFKYYSHKVIFFSVCLFISAASSADTNFLDESGFYSLQIGAAASSHQFILSKTETSSQFKNKLTDSGSWVLNPLLHFSYTTLDQEHYKKHTLLLFSDCLALPSFGYAFSRNQTERPMRVYQKARPQPNRTHYRKN